MARLVTLTLNPALDLAADAESVVHTHKIRMQHEHADPGGGGVNVARVLHELGAETQALIVTGGATGRVLEGMLDEAGVPRRSVSIAGNTRVSLNVLDRASNLEYRFVPEGPTLTDAEWRRVLQEVERVEGDWLIASGSLPHGVPADGYAQIAEIAVRKGLRMVLDTSGDALREALGHGIELVKPSLSELEHVIGRGLPGAAEQEAEAMALVRAGAARMMAVTRGADGAFLASRDGVVRQPAMRVDVHTAVGAGDAFLAGLVFALSNGESQEAALAWGTAAGAAAIACAGTARLRRDDVMARVEEIAMCQFTGT
jgi:6-phosphofructokinase 2